MLSIILGINSEHESRFWWQIHFGMAVIMVDLWHFGDEHLRDVIVQQQASSNAWSRRVKNKQTAWWLVRIMEHAQSKRKRSVGFGNLAVLYAPRQTSQMRSVRKAAGLRRGRASGPRAAHIRCHCLGKRVKNVDSGLCCIIRRHKPDPQRRRMHVLRPTFRKSALS